MFESIAGDTNGSIMPGWEPERMAHIKELFAMYKDIDDEKLFANLKYFLERIMPVCDKYDINMAIHPDDPASVSDTHLTPGICLICSKVTVSNLEPYHLKVISIVCNLRSFLLR